MEVEWLRGGSSGSEFISFQPKGPAGRGDVLVFFRNQNGYAPDFDQLSTRLQQVPEDKLTNRYTTSWATVGHHPLVGQNGHLIQYYAQPDDNVLHTSVDANPFLDPLEVAAADLQTLGHSGADEWVAFPIAPLSGVAAPDPRISPTIGMEEYVIFEKEIISPIRKSRISKIKPNAIATGSGRSLFQAGIVNATTPQGMLVEVADTDWQKLTMAYDSIQNLSFGDITDEFQDALQTNLLFMVASQAGSLDEGTTNDKVEITGWPFRLQVGQFPPGTTPTTTGVHRYNNVVVFKFIEESFDDMLDDTSRWATPDEFNDDTADIQAWLKDVIADAREKAEDPGTSDFYSALVENVLDNANWTGVVAFNVTVPADEMPCEVQGLLGGIRKFDEFKAHHLGFAISKVNPQGTSIEKSSIFALIDYEDDDPPTGGPGYEEYEFIVKSLKVRFANTEIADFASTIAIKMKRAFDETIKDPINIPGEKITIDTLELDGSYQTFGGVPTYTFELVAVNNPFEFAGTTDRLSLFHQMTVTKVQFATSSCVTAPIDPATDRVTSVFSYWGSVNFRQGAAFDFFSFDKLPFSDLTLTMSFGFDADGLPMRPVSPTDFHFDPGNLRFEISNSTPRSDSLLSNFPLRLKNFHYATQKLDIKELGYWQIPNFVPGWNEATNPKYALAFTIDMGPLNGPSAKKKVKGAIDIIAAWEPTEYGDGVNFGVKLGEGSDGNKEFGIEGVLTLAVDNFGFMKIPENPADGVGYVYAFFIKSAFLKVVNTQIPPGGDFSLMLFVPYSAENTVNLKNLGWFVAYNRSGGSSTGGGSSPHDIEVDAVRLKVGNSIVTSVDINTNVTVEVVVKNTGTAITEPQKVKISVKAEAVDPSSNRPLPPTPPMIEVTVAHNSDNSSNPAVFTWPAKVAGSYKFIATANILGDLTPGNNTGESGELEVKAGANKKEKRSVIKLDYLGLGHRVVIPPGDLELQMLNTVESVISVMRDPNEGLVPSQSGTALREQLQKIYDPEAGILIGIDVTIMDVVRIAFLFAQTNNLYGALIGFVEKAPSFIKGFQFQILYKKLTDDLGVYQMQLKLPDKFRQFELGAASITIPVIGIDIYTNGNFKLDFGFPANANFANSFCIQMMAGPIPIIGYAGFYFALLSGATSTLVPVFKANSTAQWKPVMEFGIGLSLGIGKSIEKGPLRAGFSVSIVVILEGALAWYQPPGGQTVSTLGNPPDWYRVKGMAGLVAQIYGILDFGIVKLGLEVNASAMFSFVYESYKDIELGVTLSVSVRVTIVLGSFKIFGKTVRIEVSFSFSATFSFSFTVKNPQGLIAPWNNELVTPVVQNASALRSLQQATLTPIAWTPLDVSSATGVLSLTFAPQVTVAKEGDDQYAHAVAGLTIASGNASAFNGLALGLIEWAVRLHMGGTNPTLTLADLEDLDARLNIPRTLATTVGNNSLTPLDYTAILDFLEENYDSIAINPVATFNPNDPEPGAVEATVFPMLPELRMTTSGQQGGNADVDFGSFNPQNDAYQMDVAEYFDRLLVDVENKSGVFLSNRVLQQAGVSVSMATIIFQDYFAFLVKGGVDRAVEYMKSASSDSINLVDLLSNLVGDGHLSALSSMASRFFFNGLRLPESFPANPDYIALSDNAVPLYVLTGQQVPIKLTDAIPDDPNVDGDQSVPSPPWVLSLQKRTDAHALLDLDSAVSLTIATDDTEGRANVATLESIQPNIGLIVPPTLIPRLRERPMEFSFRNPTHLEVPEDTRQATLYPFPETLLQILAEKDAPIGLTLHNDDDDGVNTIGGLGTWSMRINFTARRVERTVPGPDGSGPFVDNTYVIGGTPERTRNLIGKLLANNTPGVTGMRLYFEIEGKINALVGQPLTAVSGSDTGPDVVLMKTNLSTVSAPQTDSSLLAVHPPADAYSAAMIPSQADRFLRLLWEASIVNAPGYYLYYNTEGNGDTGLPDDAFQGRANQANLSLLVTFSGLNTSCDTLLIDSASFTELDLYAEADNEVVWHPAVAPGAIAFELIRPNPENPAFVKANPDVGIEPLFNLLSYYIVDELDEGFNESIRGLPVGPSSDDLAEVAVPLNWTYRQGIRVYPYAKSGEDNIYAGTGEWITLGFEFLDIFGNVLHGASLPQLSTRVLYSDRIKGVGQWPGVSAGYEFVQSGIDGQLNVTLSFAAEQYTDLAMDAERVLTAQEWFLVIRQQLNGPGVSATMRTTVAPNRPVDIKSSLLAFVNSMLAYLSAPSGAPTSITSSLTLPAIATADRNAQADNTFAVTVELEIARTSDLVDPQALTDMSDAQSVVTSVAPEPVTNIIALPDDPPENPADTRQQLALEQFAIDFETAFPEFKIATGAGADGPRTIWAVRLVNSVPAGGVGISFSIDNQPGFFAPAPLSNKLEQRGNVLMRLLGPNEATTAENIINVDMDVIGRSFLREVDRFLSADMAATARKINSDAYFSVVDNKATLADAISAGVTNVLQSTPSQSFFDTAREVYKQGLLAKLATAYDVETAVVYPVATNNSDFPATPTPTQIPPRLYGNVTGTGSGIEDADFSFSTAKIDLNIGTAPKFAYLFNSERSSEQASAKVTVKYAITHVEHDINPAIGGYESSSWLTIVLPEEPVEVGVADIPIALREYPTPPALIGQSAIPVDLTGATTLDAATRWQYGYTFQQQAVAQDSILANIQFNVGPEVLANLLQAPPLDLLDWLARFNREYPLFASNLNLLLSGEKAIDDANQRDTVSSAIAWFANLVDGIAETWKPWVEGSATTRNLLQALVGYEWDFEYSEQLIANEIEITISRPAGSVQDSQFPNVVVTLDDGETRQSLPPSISGGVASYSYPWNAPALPEFRTRTFEFPGLDVLHTENAWGGIHLERNRNLSFPGTFRTTNPKFVYRTPEVRFVNKVTPLIDNKQPIEIARGQVRSLNGQITALLGELFDTAVSDSSTPDRLLKVGVRYAYDVRGQGGPAIGPGQTDEFQAYMPVTQAMAYTLNPNDMGVFISGLTSAIETWMSTTNPIRARGFYEFDLSIFAALSATDLPVLRLRRLWLGLDRIS